MGKYYADEWSDEAAAGPAPRWLRGLLAAVLVAVAVGSAYLAVQCLPPPEPPTTALETLSLSDRLPFPDVAVIHQSILFAHRLAYRRGFLDGAIVGGAVSLILSTLAYTILRKT